MASQVLTVATSAGTLAKPLNQIHLRDVLPLWVDERKPTEGTQAKAEKALRDYERLSGNPTLDKLNKQAAGAYGAALVKEGQARSLSGNTLASYLNIIKGIGTVASNKLDGFVENPFKAVTMPEIAPTELLARALALPAADFFSMLSRAAACWSRRSGMVQQSTSASNPKSGLTTSRILASVMVSCGSMRTIACRVRSICARLMGLQPVTQ